MSRLSPTERETAEQIIVGLSEALATARADGRKEGLREAAAWHDQLAEDYRRRLHLYRSGRRRPRIVRRAPDATEADFIAREEWHRASATAIRARIGTDPTTDRGEG